MDSEDKAMLQAMGLKSIDELFADIPSSVQTRGLDLPKGMEEQMTRQELRDLLAYLKSLN